MYINSIIIFSSEMVINIYKGVKLYMIIRSIRMYDEKAEKVLQRDWWVKGDDVECSLKCLLERLTYRHGFGVS